MGMSDELFFIFFRLLRALAGIRVAWFVEIRRVLAPLVPDMDLFLQVSQHGTKCTTWSASISNI